MTSFRIFMFVATLAACAETAPTPTEVTPVGHRPSAEVDPARVAPDPCATLTAVQTCESAGHGACGWFGDAGCIGLFGRAIGEVDDVGDEPLLDLGERFVTLDELADAPLTSAERTAAAEHRASIARSFAPETAEAEFHTSSYCGHGSSTNVCNIIGHWWVEYSFSINTYCGSQRCHDHKYMHYSYLCNADAHGATRTCGSTFH